MLLDNSDYEIISQYNSELRGFSNFYAFAPKYESRRVEKSAIDSMFKTPAFKHKTSVKSIRGRLKKGNEHMLHYRVKGERRPLIVFKLKHRSQLKKRNVDHMPDTNRYNNRTELVERLRAGKCEYCEKEKGYFEVHHFRKIEDIKDGKEKWQKHMISRKRKTLVLCVECHNLLHAGKLQSWRKSMYSGNGEPDAGKLARPGSEGGSRLHP